MPKESFVLRTHRRKWALTQRDLASLIGISSVHHVSRVERSKSAPGLKFVLASEIVLGVHARHLFPKFFDQIEEEVVRNLFHFGERLKDDNSRSAARKHQLDDEALGRATEAVEQPNDV